MSTKREPMLDIYVFEAYQMIEKLEQSVLQLENDENIEATVNEIFRIMHTLKGNSAMMLFNNIAELAHKMEDLFDLIRKNKPEKLDKPAIADLVLKCADFIKAEVDKIDETTTSDGDHRPYMEEVLAVLNAVAEGKPIMMKAVEKVNMKYYISSETAAHEKKTRYFAHIRYKEDCEMENVRAFSVVHDLEDIVENILHIPKGLIEDPEAGDIIRRNGFRMSFDSILTLEDIKKHLNEVVFLESLEVREIEEDEKDEVQAELEKKKIKIELGDFDEREVVEESSFNDGKDSKDARDEEYEPRQTQDLTVQKERNHGEASAAKMVSVDVEKLDKLMDMVGELVISEAMVTRNPELDGLALDSFQKAARQLRKITDDLQDIAMSMRMVSVSSVFQKMKRLVRDMAKKTEKEIYLELIGEDTEADKNIIEQIGDPLMHLIRNAADHGIEQPGERLGKGKNKAGTISLEARNVGSEVWIIVKDDGKGLDKANIYKKAFENGLTAKTESEISEKEIFSYIFLPGFSTKEKVTEFSGRGVGMDVVSKNIEKIRGNIQVESTKGLGSSFTIKIPLTLSIVDGMTIRVGKNRYTMPITTIKESFRLSEESLIEDLEGNTLVMVRGEPLPIIKLGELFKVESSITELSKGIMIMVEDDGNSKVIFADELLGEQQVVVKTLPKYIKKVRGVAGCTILGDGGISLILDIPALVNK